jgi:glycine betaine/proline transport system permease protein
MPEIDIGIYAERVVDWMVDHLGGLFDAISDVSGTVVHAVQDALMAPPALLLIVVFAALALLAARAGVAAFTLLGFALIDGMGLWDETMETLAVVIVATVVAVAIGIPLGVASARHAWVRLVMRPLLDFMQTLPVFVYLIPAVFFFGVGLVPAVMATAVFAVAPAVRLTELGIRQVDPETVEAAHAFGAHPRQILREVQLPLALPSIMTGVNQVIMLSLSMVVISGLVGAGGLGNEVISAVTQLDIGRGFQGGVAVVILAMFLDRVTASLARPRGAARRRKATAAVSPEDLAAAPAPAPRPVEVRTTTRDTAAV